MLCATQCRKYKQRFNWKPEVGGMHPVMFQEFASDTHLERLGLYNPKDSIVLGHLYNWQPNKQKILRLET